MLDISSATRNDPLLALPSEDSTSSRAETWLTVYRPYEVSLNHLAGVERFPPDFTGLKLEIALLPRELSHFDMLFRRGLPGTDSVHLYSAQPMRRARDSGELCGEWGVVSAGFLANVSSIAWRSAVR